MARRHKHGDLENPFAPIALAVIGKVLTPPRFMARDLAIIEFDFGLALILDSIERLLE